MFQLLTLQTRHAPTRREGVTRSSCSLPGHALSCKTEPADADIEDASVGNTVLYKMHSVKSVRDQNDSIVFFDYCQEFYLIVHLVHSVSSSFLLFFLFFSFST